jgi:hypothetical protein
MRPPGQGEAAGSPFAAVAAECIVGVEADEVVSFGSAAFKVVDTISKKAQQSHSAQGRKGMVKQSLSVDPESVHEPFFGISAALVREVFRESATKSLTKRGNRKHFPLPNAGV